MRSGYLVQPAIASSMDLLGILCGTPLPFHYRMELVRVCQAGDVPLLRTLLSDKKTAATLSQRIGEVKIDTGAGS